jgi:hypothetical protein
VCSRDTWCRYVGRCVGYREHAAYSRVFTLARAGGGRRHGRVHGQRTDCPCAAARVHAHAHAQCTYSTDRRVFTLADAPTARPQRASGSCSVGWRQREAGREKLFPPVSYAQARFCLHVPMQACAWEQRTVPTRHTHAPTCENTSARRTLRDQMHTTFSVYSRACLALSTCI